MSHSNQTSHESEATDSDKLSIENSDEKCRLHHTIDILFILKKIMQSKTLIALYFDQSNRYILSSILAINAETKQIIIDCGFDENLNQSALCSNKLTIITAQGQVEIKFTCDSAKKIQFEDNNAFLVNLPASLIRLQRRDFFRLPAPTVKLLKCSIPLSDELNADRVELSLFDISCGGIGIIDDHPIMRFKPDAIFKGCVIQLPDLGTITATIQVKNMLEIRRRNGTKIKRVGCKFIALPDKILTMIQRYTAKLELMYKDSDAFLINFPKSLAQRLQRRDFFRLPAPTVKLLKCSIPLSDELNADRVELSLFDISCGGIGIIDDHPIMRFKPDAIFKGCVIQLPDLGTITATIQVKNMLEIRRRNGTKIKRVGCKFIALPDKILTMIQRYIIKLKQIQRLIKD